MTLRTLCRSGIIAALLALLVTFLGATPARAHATLLATNPAQGAQLDAAPTEIRLTFSEPVSVVPGSMRLLHANGPAENLTVHAVDTVVVAPLPDLAQDTRHTVAWRVVSTDGHPISGLLTFSLGNPPIGSPALTEDTAPSIALVVTQAVATGFWYAGLLLVAGLLVFQVFCVRPVAGAEGTPGTGPGLSRLVGMGAVAGSLAAMALVPLRALALTGGLSAESTDWAALVGWQNPLAALLTCTGLGAAVVFVRRGRLGAALGSAVPALVSPVLTGHSVAVEPVWLMIAGDVVHLAATAVWGGGLLGLVLYLRRFRQAAGAAPTAGSVRNVAQMVSRFSGLAGSTLVTAGLAGVVMALLILPSRAALLGTSYGRLLLIKLALVALTGAMGGWNRLRLVPALERPGAAADPWRALTRILRLEVAVLALVVVVTGFLVGQSPTGGGAEHTGHAGHDHASSATGPTPVRGTSDRLVVSGRATPVGDGITQLEFTVADPGGARVHPAEPPTVTATLPAHNLGPTRYETRDNLTASNGTYLAEVETPVPGRWQLLVGVRLSAFTQETVRLELDVG